MEPSVVVVPGDRAEMEGAPVPEGGVVTKLMASAPATDEFAEGACVSTVRFTAVDAAVLVPPSDCDEVTLHAPSDSAGSEHPPVDAVATKVQVFV